MTEIGSRRIMIPVGVGGGIQAGCVILLLLLLNVAALSAQSFRYRTSIEADGRSAAGEEWFAGAVADYSLRALPFDGEYIVEAGRAVIPATAFSAGVRYGEDKLHRTIGDRITTVFGRAAFLVKDDLAIGPLLRYELRESGVGTDFTRDYHNTTIAAMAVVYGKNIRMRWIVGAGLQRKISWFAGSTRHPEQTVKDDDGGLVLENHMDLASGGTGYSHVIRASIFGDWVQFRFAPSLEFALTDRLTLGPLFDGWFGGGTGGAAISSEIGLACRWYVHPSVFINVTPRYPVLIFDDHQLDGVFWSASVGWRM